MKTPIKPLVDKGYAHHRKGEFAEAEALYQQVLGLDPQNADAMHYLGILSRQTDRLEAGLTLLRHSITLSPKEANFHYNLANALDDDGQFEEAVDAYRKAIELKPNYTDAQINLGLILQKVGKYEEALAILQQAAEAAPNSALAHQNLAQLYDTLGLRTQAFMEMVQAVNAKRSVETLTGLSSLLRRCGDRVQAVKVAQEAVELDSSDAEGWLELGQAQAANDANEEAAAAYRRVVEIDPGNTEAAFFLAAVQGQTPEIAPREFIAQHYDDYANQFDAHLEKELEYRVPQKLLEAVKRARGNEEPMDILDAGCGTGLAGVVFKPLAKSLIGVDLSREMVRHAAHRKIYDRLVVNDLGEELRNTPAAFDLVLAADVFIHLGDLREVFAASAAALRSKGLLAFSVESHDGADFVLQPTRRFAHAGDYLRKLAIENGFVDKSLEPDTIRMEKGQPVPGFLGIFQKS